MFYVVDTYVIPIIMLDESCNIICPKKIEISKVHY